MILPGWQNKFSIFGGLLFLAAQTAVSAQDRGWADMLPGLKERAVVLNIVARVMERDEEEVWNSQNSKITIPGQPVGIKLVGANVVVAVQFTPYLRPNGPNVLVAQGQIWVEIPGQGIHYQTTMQTIPLEFGERIFFFPLGSVNARSGAAGEAGENPYIEIQLELRPYAAAGGEPPADAESSPPAQAEPENAP